MLVEIKMSCCRMEWDTGRQGNNNTEWHNHGGDSGKRGSGVKKYRCSFIHQQRTSLLYFSSTVWQLSVGNLCVPAHCPACAFCVWDCPLLVAAIVPHPRLVVRLPSGCACACACVFDQEVSLTFHPSLLLSTARHLRAAHQASYPLFSLSSSKVS